MKEGKRREGMRAGVEEKRGDETRREKVWKEERQNMNEGKRREDEGSGKD